MKSRPARFPVIDAFKAAASQLIVLHHLAAYGPISDAVQQAAPELISWLYDHARMAVQAFIVIGGYLSAKALTSHHGGSSPLSVTVCNRYLRLVLPYLAALAISVVCAMVARQHLSGDFVPDAPSWAQVLAHVFLLQSLLEFDALSAGAWYIAIDFQLFLLMASLIWLGSKTRHAGNGLPMLVVLLAASSLFWFNRNPALDDWAPYFFGAYGMGALAYLAGQGEHHRSGWFWMIAALTLVALLVDFRARLAIALAVALTLFFAGNSRRVADWMAASWLQYLGRISYSLFLIHFPILLLANTAFVYFGQTSPLAGCIGMLAAWGSSLIAADAFHRHIEQPATALKAQAMIQSVDAGRLRSLRFRLVATAWLALAIPV